MTSGQTTHAKPHGASLPSSALNRRQFLKRLGILGGGILVYFNAGDAVLWAQSRSERFLRAPRPEDFNAFLRIGVDGKVTGFTGKIEMGQGIITSLPQMLAEELDVAYDVVSIVMGDTDLCPWDMGTFGSLSTRLFGVTFRKAAAEAKGVLKELASEHLRCPVDRLETRDGHVFDRNSPAKRMSYGQLTKGNIVEKRLETEPDLKPVSQFTVMGEPRLRRDAVEKVTGKAEYAADIRLPGMLYASVLRPPAHGAKLRHLDTSAAEKQPGVQVVREDTFTAVLHNTPDGAERAISRIEATYDTQETGVNDRTIFDHLVENAPTARTVSQDGSLQTPRETAAHTFDEAYLNSYVAHAPIEPHAATAKVEEGKVTVWASTQTPFTTKQMIAGMLKLKPDQVRVITPHVGGGFGGKTGGNQAVEAAFLAMRTSRPVQVAWSREEEFFMDSFRPAAVVNIQSGLNAVGGIAFWDYRVYFAGDRGCELYYDIPNHQVISYGGWMGGGSSAHPFSVGPWRAPSNNTNTYARELHINIMAAKAGADPLAFRLRNLKDERMIRVLKAAAGKFGWQPSRIPSGNGYGIACGIDAGTYVATIAEVDVEKATGSVAVKRVVCAQDMGTVVNPQGATIQMEGCITMGLGYALSEEVRFENGEIFDHNFGTYTIPRFSWVPKIETVIVENPELPPQGGGEPAIITMGGVVASAIYDATGAKLLQLPMTPERVRKAVG